MNRLKYSIPTRILHTLYCTLITPYLNYGILIWGSACKSYQEKLIKLQQWAIRTCITNSHYRAHTVPLFAKNNLLNNVTDIYSLELGVFMYRYSIKGPYTDYILIPRVQPEVVCVLVSNESPYFSHYNPKISALNSLYFGSYSRNVYISGIPIFTFLCIFITASSPVSYTCFWPRRENKKSA